MTTVNAHLRDCHGYTLAESVKWAPPVMEDIHAEEHRNCQQDHTHEPERTR